MRKGTKIVLFIGLGILAAGLIMVIAISAANQFSLRRIAANATEGGVQIEKEAKRIEMDITDPFTDVTILCVSDDITIKESADGTCHLTYTEDAYTSYDVSVEQGKLIIKQETEDVTWSWGSLSEILPQLLNKGFSELAAVMDGETHDLILTLPSAVYGTFEIANVSGDISLGTVLLSGSQSSGTLAGEGTASGETTAGGTTGGETAAGLTVGNVTIATTSGDLHVEGLLGLQNISAATTSGEVELRNMQLSGDVAASTTSGDITLDHIETSGKATLATTSGEVKLTETVLGSGDVEGISGNIIFSNSDADTMKIHVISGDVRGTIRSPKEFHVESTSGDVSVPEIGSAPGSSGSAPDSGTSGGSGASPDGSGSGASPDGSGTGASPDGSGSPEGGAATLGFWDIETVSGDVKLELAQ